VALNFCGSDQRHEWPAKLRRECEPVVWWRMVMGNKVFFSARVRNGILSATGVMKQKDLFLLAKRVQNIFLADKRTKGIVDEIIP
jgi:hypothetical protein